MGNFRLDNTYTDKHCADGADWPDTMNTIAAAMDNVMNYRQATNQVYGSHRLLTEDFPFLRREINQEYIRLTGMALDHSVVRMTDGQLQCLWEKVRKGHYKIRKRGTAVRHDRPLFGEIEGASVVYAYTATIAKFPTIRVVKIGFTTANIDDYLRSHRIAHMPKLLATTVGDERLERHYKQQMREYVADGNEWLFPARKVFDWIVHTYNDLATNFRVHMEEAESLYAIWTRDHNR